MEFFYILIAIVIMLIIGYFAVLNEDKKIIEERNRFTPEQINERKKYDMQGIKYCPYCLSTKWQYAGQETIGATDDKIKTSYSLNLNPLKPFTVVNKKQKVVKGYKGVTRDKYVCLKCGKTF